MQTVGGLGARKLIGGKQEPSNVQGQLPVLVSPAQYTVLVRDVPDPRTLSRWARPDGSLRESSTRVSIFRACLSHLHSLNRW